MVLAKFLYTTKSGRNFALLFQHNARFFCLTINYAGIMWTTLAAELRGVSCTNASKQVFVVTIVANIFRLIFVDYMRITSKLKRKRQGGRVLPWRKSWNDF